jgi:predicted phosphodiesterase
MPEGGFLMNPGSTTFPRTAMGPTMGRVTIEDGGVADVEIVRLFPEDGTAAARDDEGRRHWWG